MAKHHFGSTENWRIPWCRTNPHTWCQKCCVSRETSVCWATTCFYCYPLILLTSVIVPFIFLTLWKRKSLDRCHEPWYLKDWTSVSHRRREVRFKGEYADDISRCFLETEKALSFCHLIGWAPLPLPLSFHKASAEALPACHSTSSQELATE